MHSRFLGVALVAGLLAPLTACSQAFVNNPRRSGLDCSQTRFWPIVDVAIAAAGTAFLVTQGTATDEPVTLVAPAVFLGSAVWGNVKVGRCKRMWNDATPEQIAAFHQEQREQAARAAQQRAEDEARAREQARLNAEARADAQARAEAQARADEQAYPQAPPPAYAPPPQPEPARQAPVRYEPRSQPTVSVSRETRQVGVWNTTSRDACMSRDWVAKSGLSGADAQLRTQVMRDACTTCVDQGKRFALHEEGKTISSCN